VDPVVTNNYQQIVDYMWTVLKGNTVTSINKNTDDSQFSVFPNPAQNQLYVLTNESDFEIEISNLLGQNVLKIKNNPQLDVSQLTKGSYLLNYKGKKTITKKIFITE
jgi:hypothetical protein